MRKNKKKRKKERGKVALAFDLKTFQKMESKNWILYDNFFKLNPTFHFQTKIALPLFLFFSVLWIRLFVWEWKLKKMWDRKHLFLSCSTFHSVIVTAWWIYVFFLLQLSDKKQFFEDYEKNKWVRSNILSLTTFSGSYMITSVVLEWEQMRFSVRLHHLLTGVLVLLPLVLQSSIWLHYTVFHGLILEFTTPFLNYLFAANETQSKFQKSTQRQQQQEAHKVFGSADLFFIFSFAVVRCAYPPLLMYEYFLFWQVYSHEEVSTIAWLYFVLWFLFMGLQFCWFFLILRRYWQKLILKEKNFSKQT